MGWQVGSSCYASEGAAAAAAASSMGGAVVQHGSTAYVVGVSGYSGTSITYQLSPVDGGVPITLVAPYTAVPCGLLEWGDGLALGWAVVGVWVGVLALRMIAQAVRGDRDDT